MKCPAGKWWVIAVITLATAGWACLVFHFLERQSDAFNLFR